MSDEFEARYKALYDRYQTVVHERDLLKDRLDLVEPELLRFKGKELMALVCDNHCGRCVVGADEQTIYLAAQRTGWIVTDRWSIHSSKHYCAECMRDPRKGPS